MYEDGTDTLSRNVRDKRTEQQPRRTKISATPRKSLQSRKQQRTVPQDLNRQLQTLRNSMETAFVAIVYFIYKKSKGKVFPYLRHESV